jgi:hypothetical protein
MTGSTYMQPGGDYPFQKDLMTPPRMHARQFKEILWIAKALPAGNWPKPLEVLVLKWFYILFHKNNCSKFVTSGRKLDTETFKLVTEFFEAHFTTNKNNGTLERMELERIKKQVQLKLKNELCNKICACEDERRPYRAKRKIASCNTQHRPYNNCKERRWYIDRDCDYDCAYYNKHQAAKCPCVKHPSYHDRKDDHCNNQPKKLDYEKPKSNSKIPCPIHSFPDKPVKHSWADCSKNPANQQKQALWSAVSAHHAAIDNRFLSNDDRSPMELDHTEAVNNQSLNRCSFSNCNDNAFMTFKAPPPPEPKKAAEKVERDNRLAKSGKKATAPSKNNGKAMAFTQPFAVLAKGLHKPLAFSLESNWWYAPVVGTSLVGNSLNVKDIKPEPAIVPGNAPKIIP